jgi:very-short-patch-repair endonuclease
MSLGPRGAFDTPPDLRAAWRATRQHGCLRFDQLVECGLDDAAVARRVQKGWLHRVHHGVYAVGHVPQTLDARFMAAVLAGGDDAFLSRWATCGLAGLMRWNDRPVDVTVRGSAQRRREGIHFHRARSLDPRDVTRIHDIPTVTPARAILEIAPQLSDRRLKRLVRQAQAETLASVRQFEADLRWPAQRLILEIDSAWHDGPIAHALDAERQAELEAAGERVLRTTKERALADTSQLVARLSAAGAPYRYSL